MPEQRAAQLEELAKELKAQSEQLQKDLADFDAKHRRERRAYGLLGVFLIASVAVGGILVTSSRDTLDYVKSCTTPTGKCYQQSRAGTVDFRKQLLSVTAVITDCDVLHDDNAKFRACVKTRTGLDASAKVLIDPQT